MTKYRAPAPPAQIKANGGKFAGANLLGANLLGVKLMRVRRQLQGVAELCTKDAERNAADGMSPE